MRSYLDEWKFTSGASERVYDDIMFVRFRVYVCENCTCSTEYRESYLSLKRSEVGVLEVDR